MRELEKGRKVRKTPWNKECYIILDKTNNIVIDEEGCISYAAYIDSNSWELYEEPILDEQEKEYIRNTIKFCYNQIEKIILLDGGKNVVLEFVSYNGNRDYSPFLKKNMFKGMKAKHPYTLEELGLDD